MQKDKSFCKINCADSFLLAWHLNCDSTIIKGAVLIFYDNQTWEILQITTDLIISIMLEMSGKMLTGFSEQPAIFYH